MENIKNLVSDLGMQVIDKKSNRYKKDKVELYWMPGDCFGVTNEGTSFVNVVWNYTWRFLE